MSLANRHLAECIADAVMTNGLGERAGNLVLMTGGRNLGGWSREPFIDQVEAVLNRENNVARVSPQKARRKR